MKLPAFKTINFPDQELARFQDSVSTAFQGLLSNPLAKVSVLTGVVLAIGDNTVNHLLGATPSLWIIADKNAAGDVFRKTSTSPALTLLLNSSAVMTVTLIVA